MKFQHIFYLIFAALLISACQPSLPDPDTDAVYKSISKIYELNEDGSVNYQYKHTLKYLTHYAFNRAYGESFVVYNPNKQELKVNHSLTSQANGTQVHSPENAYNEVLPGFAAGAPAFNHLRELVVTHAGLELGCVVDFDYELKSQKGYIPFLNENILLAESSPIQVMEIIVRIPEGKTLNYKLLNAEAEPKISTKKGVTTYKWKFNQLAQKSFDGDQPHYNETLPRLVFSTATVPEALKTLSTDTSVPEEIIVKVDENIKDAKTDFDTLFELQNIVANEMNAFHIPFEHTGYMTRNFADIWKTNGATDLEKTLFLSALLNHNKIEAKPILANPVTIYDGQIGLLKNTGHAYVLINIDNKPFIISATSAKAKNNLAYALINEVLIDLEGNVIEFDKEQYGSAKHISVKGEFELSYGGNIKGGADLTLKGFANPYFSLVKDEKKVEGIAKKALSGIKINKAKLVKWDNKSSTINFSFDKKEAATKQEAYNFFKFPKSSLGINALHLDYLTEQRTAPIQIGGPLEEEYDFNIQIPSGYVLVSGNVDTVLTNSAGEVSIKLEQTMHGIVIYKKLFLNKKVVPVAEYADFRNLFLLWNSKNYNEISLKETPK